MRARPSTLTRTITVTRTATAFLLIFRLFFLNSTSYFADLFASLRSSYSIVLRYIVVDFVRLILKIRELWGDLGRAGTLRSRPNFFERLGSSLRHYLSPKVFFGPIRLPDSLKIVFLQRSDIADGVFIECNKVDTIKHTCAPSLLFRNERLTVLLEALKTLA